MTTPTAPAPRRTLVDRFLDGVEKIGNKLPDPVMIFIAICALVLIASWLAAAAGVSVTNPATGKTVAAVNLLSADGLRRILSEAVKNFGAFPALGLVLVVMLGIGVAEKTGYFEVAMRRVIERAPQAMIIPVIIFTAVLGNVAGDAAPIVLPPLAAMVFLRLGLHPVAGVAMAYAAALGGFAANLILGMSDALVLAFTAPAAALVDPTVETNTAMNYYFIAASTFLLTAVVWVVATRVGIPRLGRYDNPEFVSQEQPALTPQEIKALRAANWSLLAVVGVLLALSTPSNGLLRNATTGSLIQDSPLMNGIGLIITLFFFVPGLVYGLVAGKIRSGGDLAGMMTSSMASMGGFIVIVFFAAQMLAFFNWSNLGTIIAVKGAELLQNQHGMVLIVGVVILSSIVNIFIGSASAKWAILAPIFVPMMMLLGFHPAFTQMIYRVGDSITNPITPMLPYFPLVLGLAQKYDKKMGIGTLIAALLPYSIAIGVCWTIFLLVWFWLGWPVGPGGPIYLNTPVGG